MKGKRVRIGCAAASLLMGISGTYAYYRSSVETINKIAVGDVNIGILEYEEDGDGEKKYCRKIPGTFQDLYLRLWRKNEILYWFCRLYDKKYSKACRSGSSGLFRKNKETDPWTF